MEAYRRNAMEVEVGKRCPHGITCWYGAWGRCRGVHTAKEHEQFHQKEKMHALGEEIRCEEARSPCSWCAQDCCRFGEECRRGLKVDSEYESAEDDTQEAEATGQGKRAPRTVEGSTVGRTAPARWKKLEREREGQVRKMGFRSEGAPAKTVGEEG